MAEYKLKITLIEAIELRNTQLLGKQDPYAIVKLGTTWFKTSVHENGQNKGVWGETFELPARLDKNVEIQVKNKNLTSTETIGECEILISQFLHGGELEGWYQLFNGKTPAGKVHIRAQFSPPIAGHCPPTDFSSVPMATPLDVSSAGVSPMLAIPMTASAPTGPMKDMTISSDCPKCHGTGFKEKKGEKKPCKCMEKKKDDKKDKKKDKKDKDGKKDKKDKDGKKDKKDKDKKKDKSDGKKDKKDKDKKKDKDGKKDKKDKDKKKK
eukprot:TRINITY_DN226166_c0_g1_i3.p1 TRINITY_DN226166_c0_g1~~TRINITY_DN226166_c0_g1_i3.p1  ORF type:complete len:267 (-),score=98.00 TRINITY_DN226166_c0_g1_i3:361-1161(-)